MRYFVNEQECDSALFFELFREKIPKEEQKIADILLLENNYYYWIKETRFIKFEIKGD